MIEISSRVIQRLRAWNQDRQNQSLDRLYALALLLVLVSCDDIRAGNIDEDVLRFIRGMKYEKKYKFEYWSFDMFFFQT